MPGADLSTFGPALKAVPQPLSKKAIKRRLDKKKKRKK